jgi:hypothetical protein
MNSRDLYFIRSCVKRQSPVYYRGFSTRGDWVEVKTTPAFYATGDRLNNVRYTQKVCAPQARESHLSHH